MLHIIFDIWYALRLILLQVGSVFWDSETVFPRLFYKTKTFIFFGVETLVTWGLKRCEKVVSELILNHKRTLAED